MLLWLTKQQKNRKYLSYHRVLIVLFLVIAEKSRNNYLEVEMTHFNIHLWHTNLH